MRDKIKIDLGSLQETLFIPLLFRAKESEKDNPLLYDGFAREIISKIDYDFSSIEKGIDINHQIVWVIRALNFDNLIKKFLAENDNVLVINIGAGLDTTFNRVDDGSIYWVNIDLPDVIDLRLELTGNADRETNIAKSVFDFSWIDDISRLPEGRSILFLAAGVLCYFEASELKKLFVKLSDVYPASHLIFDTMSWLTVWGANRSIMKKSGMDPSALLKWHLKRPSRLKNWVTKIEIIEEFSMFSRLPSKTDLSNEILRGMKISDLLGMYKMVHARL